MVEAAAVIAFSIGIFSLFAGHGGRHNSPGGKNTATTHLTCSPSQATASLAAHAILTAIAPIGTDDGWAVGGTSDPNQPTSPPSTVILRLQNCHWTPFGTPISSATLHDISMVSADEGWMLLYGGKHPVSSEPNQSVGYANSLLHYQNGTWTDVPMTFKKPQMTVSDLDARQSGDVWVVGMDNSSGGTQALAAHYLRGVWTSYTGATIVADPRVLASGTDLNSVSMLSATDVWAAGSGIYHFDGTRWTQASAQGTRSGATVVGDIPPLSARLQWPLPPKAGLSLT